jgi:hypothetical protein
MAQLTNCSVKITYEGTPDAVAALDAAFREKSDPAVKRALAYVKKYYGTTDIDGRSFEMEEIGDGRDKPNAFVFLGRKFPDAAFIFDFWYYGEAAGCDGDGRYYCVYENGEKVYDADSWLEQYTHLNGWLYTLGVEGNFYDADDEERKELLARGRLVEQGKKPDKITDEDVEAFLEDFDEENSGLNMGIPCNFAEFLVYGKNYEARSKDLNDGDYGYEHYRSLKEEGELPSLNAEHNIFSFDAGEEDDGDDWTLEKALAAVKENSLALRDVPEELKTAELCLEAVKQKGWILSFVPEELRIAELCLEAVKQDGKALTYVPEESKTAELCLEAVKQSGYALKYEPEELKTAELCLMAVI